MTEQERAELIRKGVRIRRSMDKLKVKLDAVALQLLTLPKGKYTTATGEGCQVIDEAAGATKYTLPTGKEEEARKLCGPVRFSQLFDRLVIRQPCEGFEAVAGRILPPDKAADLVTLCAVPGRPGKKYIRW